MEPLKVTFDKNVYEFVVDPGKSADVSESMQVVYKALNQLVRNKLIQPFISETILTYEVLSRKDRQKILSHEKPILISHEGSKTTIYSNPNIHPGNHFKDDLYLAKAIEMGFKILPGKRFGKLVNPAIKKEWYYFTGEEYLDISERFSKVVKEIQKRGAGYRYYQEVSGALDMPHLTSIEILKRYKGSEKKLSAAISEWSDGDSVALHITYGLDFFCTYDQGKSAGKRSVFSSDICHVLEEIFGFKKVTPSELLEHIRLYR